MSNQIQILESKIQKLDEVARGYQLARNDNSPFATAFVLSQAIVSLRGLLSTEIMKPIMSVMNTDLGFRTDKDPLQKSKDGGPMFPYSEGVVKECVIEATLRGFHVAGNEFNIIAGRFYAAKNGLRRKVSTYPELTDFKDHYEVPRTVGDKGAIVKCKATWKKGGISDSVEREIPVKVNSFMGTDAILGKAERKLLNIVYNRLSGVILSDGEVTDGDISNAKPVVGTVVEPDLDIVLKKVSEVKANEVEQELEIPTAEQTIDTIKWNLPAMGITEEQLVKHLVHMKPPMIPKSSQSLESMTDDKAFIVLKSLEKIAESIKGL